LDAQARLSELLDQVEKGAQFIITRHGTPIAQLVPLRAKAKGRAGFAKGTFLHVADDFNAPLNDFAEYS